MVLFNLLNYNICMYEHYTKQEIGNLRELRHLSSENSHEIIYFEGVVILEFLEVNSAELIPHTLSYVFINSCVMEYIVFMLFTI